MAHERICAMQLARHVQYKAIEKPERPGVMYSFTFADVNDGSWEPKESYVLHLKNGGERGGHYHRVAEEVMICLAGKVTICLSQEQGGVLKTEEVNLEPGKPGVFIPKGVWHKVLFDPGAVLLVFNDKAHGPTGYHDANGVIDEFEDQCGEVL